MIYMINKNTVRFLEIMKPHKLIERESECEEMKRYMKIKKFTKICSGFVQVTYAAYTLFQNFGLNFIYLYERYHEKNVLPLKSIGVVWYEINSKYEYRNTKQIRMFKKQKFKTKIKYIRYLDLLEICNLVRKILVFEFRICFGFPVLFLELYSTH